jgi:hypothetical protein
LSGEHWTVVSSFIFLSHYIVDAPFSSSFSFFARFHTYWLRKKYAGFIPKADNRMTFVSQTRMVFPCVHNAFCQNMHDCTMYTLFKSFRHQLLYSKISYPKWLNCSQADTRPGTISRDGFGFWWQVISTTLAVPQRELWPQFCVWKCQQITWTKAYRQSVSPYCATNIINPTCVGIYQKNYF